MKIMSKPSSADGKHYSKDLPEYNLPKTVLCLLAGTSPLLDSRGRKNYTFWPNSGILGIMWWTVTLFPVQGNPCLCGQTHNRWHFTLYSTHSAPTTLRISRVFLHLSRLSTTTSHVANAVLAEAVPPFHFRNWYMGFFKICKVLLFFGQMLLWKYNMNFGDILAKTKSL